jgi:hypothetical protein
MLKRREIPPADSSPRDQEVRDNLRTIAQELGAVSLARAAQGKRAEDQMPRVQMKMQYLITQLINFLGDRAEREFTSARGDVWVVRFQAAPEQDGQRSGTHSFSFAKREGEHERALLTVALGTDGGSTSDEMLSVRKVDDGEGIGRRTWEETQKFAAAESPLDLDYSSRVRLALAADLAWLEGEHPDDDNAAARQVRVLARRFQDERVAAMIAEKLLA